MRICLQKDTYQSYHSNTKPRHTIFYNTMSLYEKYGEQWIRTTVLVRIHYFKYCISHIFAVRKFSRFTHFTIGKNYASIIFAIRAFTKFIGRWLQSIAKLGRWLDYVIHRLTKMPQIDFLFFPTILMMMIMNNFLIDYLLTPVIFDLIGLLFLINL